MPNAAAASSGVAAPRSMATTRVAITAANRAVVSSRGRVGPKRSMSLPCATEPIDTPTSVLADTRPATAKSPVRCRTNSRAEMPIIAMGSRARAEAIAGHRTPGVLSARR